MRVPSAVRRLRPAACLFLITWIGTGADARADPPAEEFPVVKQALADALRGSLSRYPRGQATYAIRTETRSDLSGSFMIETSEGTVVWGGEDARWESRERFFLSEEEEENARPRGDGPPDKIRIYRDGALTVYDPDGGWVVVRPTVPDKIGGTLRARPTDSWFHQVGEDFRPWYHLLESLELDDGPGRPEAEAAVRVRGEAVTVRADTRAGKGRHQMTMEAVLDDPPRVLSWSAESPGGSYVSKYSATWDRNANGLLYPSRIESAMTLQMAERTPGEGGREYQEKFVLTLADFDARPPRTRDRFTLAGLKLPTGTKVTYKNARGRTLRRQYVGGKKPPKRDVFKALAEELRGGAFAGEGEGDE